MTAKGGPSLTDGWPVYGVSSPDCSRTKDSEVDVLEKKGEETDRRCGVFEHTERRFYSSFRGFRVRLVMGTWKVSKGEKQLLTPGKTKSYTKIEMEL